MVNKISNRDPKTHESIAGQVRHIECALDSYQIHIAFLVRALQLSLFSGSSIHQHHIIKLKKVISSEEVYLQMYSFAKLSKESV